MSRIGKNPIKIEDGVTLTVDGRDVTVKGKLGELAWTLPPGIGIDVQESEILMKRENEMRQTKAFHGLARSLVQNMVTGVTTGYTKTLVIEGVGFKAELQGTSVFLSLGFANAKEYKIPEGVDVSVENSGLSVVVKSIDKQLVGRVAADIRSYSPAEPYKGKGIRYSDEKIRRKEGKTVA